MDDGALVTMYSLPPTQYARTLPMFGGIWRLILDVYRVSPVYAAKVKPVPNSAHMDLFWLHGTLDILNSTDLYFVAVAAVGVLLITILICY